MTAGTLTRPPAYRDGNVLRWLGAYTSSVSGDVVYFLALSWAVTRGAGPAQVGAVLAAAAVPRAVLMLAGGVVADRFGPRRVVIGSDLVRCVVVFAAAALTWSGAVELWMLFALALVFGAVDALFMPAVGALPPRLVAADQLGRVQGLRTLAVRVSNAVGPMIAATVLAAGGPAGAFATAGALFTASLVLLLAVRVAPLPRTAPGGRTPWEDLRDGLRHLRANRRLASLVVVIGLGEMCFSGPVGIGLVLLTDERGWATSALGWTLTAFSLGGGASGVLLTAVSRIPRAGLNLAWSLALTAALVTAVGRAPTPGAMITLGALMGISSGVAMVISNALLQKETEPRYLGRVTSVTTLCTLGLSPLVYPLAGVVAAGWGTGVFFTGCGVVCLSAALIGGAVRTLRTARL